jgi:hypothetical protein
VSVRLMAEVFHEISSVAGSMAESGEGRGAQAVRRLGIDRPRGRKVTSIQIANAPFAAVTVCQNETIHLIHFLRSSLSSTSSRWSCI